MKKISALFLGKGPVHWFVRFISIVLAGAALDQLFVRFGVDFKSVLNIDLAHYLLAFLSVSLIAQIWINSQEQPRILETEKLAPNLAFGEAIVEYAEHLKLAGKHSTVVELRNKLTHLFHLLGLNSQRERLGRLTLEACVVIDDPISKAEVLLDDLGWAVHILGRSEQAKKNINKAIAALETVNTDEPDRKVRLALALAKSHRHLSFISTSDTEQHLHLAKCKQIIAEARKDNQVAYLFEGILKSNEAQIAHAEAFLISRNLGISEQGTIRPNDTDALTQINRAIILAQNAASIFDNIGDLEREVKVLHLLERLQESLQDDIEAAEVRAKREQLLSRSGIDGGMATIALTAIEETNYGTN